MNKEQILQERDIKSLPYYLSLCDGTNWQIRGAGSIAEWIDKLASVMELELCAGKPTDEFLFCFEDGHDLANIQTNISLKCGTGIIGNGCWSTSSRNVRYWFHDKISEVLCRVNLHTHNEIGYGMMPSLLRPIYQRSIERGGLPLHTALIERDGKGFLLAGSGRTGKSTCCRRIPDPWNSLCDDETLVLLDKENRYRAHPFPTWSEYTMKRSEKTWNVQHSVPISAIFVLKQSETDFTEPLGKGQAAILINQSATQSGGFFWKKMEEERQRKVRDRVFRNACDLAETVPVFRLHVSLHGRFWEEMEKIMNGEL